MAAIMAAMMTASTAFTAPPHLYTCISLTRTSNRHLCKFNSSSLSSTPTTTEFDITFAPPKPKRELEPMKTATTSSDTDTESELGEQFYIPWIVGDENGNLTLYSTPPTSLLHVVAKAKTSKKKKKKKKENDAKAKPEASSNEPKFSKVGPSYYDQNFRDPPQRLSKVLGAADGKEAF